MHIITLMMLLQTPDIKAFTDANSLYNKAQYDSSIQKYESLVSKGINNHSLYYNLGNSYFKIGRIGEAVYYYKKARKLAPYDRDINFNLNFARARRADNIKINQYPKFIRVFINFFASLSVNLLSVIASVLYFILAALVVIFLLYQKHLFGGSLKIWIASALAIVIIVLAINLQKVNSREGVLVEEASEVRSGPSEEYTLVFTIHEGMELKIMEEQKGWMRIVLPDGLEGWIPASKIKKV